MPNDGNFKGLRKGKEERRRKEGGIVPSGSVSEAQTQIHEATDRHELELKPRRETKRRKKKKRKKKRELLSSEANAPSSQYGADKQVR